MKNNYKFAQQQRAVLEKNNQKKPLSVDNSKPQTTFINANTAQKPISFITNNSPLDNYDIFFEYALKTFFNGLDAGLLKYLQNKEGGETSGAMGVVCLRFGNQLYTANTGKLVTLLLSPGDITEQLGVIHVIDPILNPIEKNRILQNFPLGTIPISKMDNGELAFLEEGSSPEFSSRALGHAKYKPWGLIAEPDVTSTDINHDKTLIFTRRSHKENKAPNETYDAVSIQNYKLNSETGNPNPNEIHIWSNFEIYGTQQKDVSEFIEKNILTGLTVVLEKQQNKQKIYSQILQDNINLLNQISGAYISPGAQPSDLYAVLNDADNLDIPVIYRQLARLVQEDEELAEKITPSILRYLLDDTTGKSSISQHSSIVEKMRKLDAQSSSLAINKINNIQKILEGIELSYKKQTQRYHFGAKIIPSTHVMLTAYAICVFSGIESGSKGFDDFISFIGVGTEYGLMAPVIGIANVLEMANIFSNAYTDYANDDNNKALINFLSGVQLGALTGFGIYLEATEQTIKYIVDIAGGSIALGALAFYTAIRFAVARKRANELQQHIAHIDLIGRAGWTKPNPTPSEQFAISQIQHETKKVLMRYGVEINQEALKKLSFPEVHRILTTAQVRERKAALYWSKATIFISIAAVGLSFSTVGVAGALFLVGMMGYMYYRRELKQEEVHARAVIIGVTGYLSHKKNDISKQIVDKFDSNTQTPEIDFSNISMGDDGAVESVPFKCKK